MIIMGAGICQWFHGDATYRAILALLILTGCDGPQRRRLGALRRPGEVPPDHRLDLAGQRPGLVAAAADHDRHRVLVHAHRPVALRRLPRRRAGLTAGRGPASPACTPPTRSPSRRGWAGCRSTRSSTRTRWTWPTRPRRPWTPARPPTRRRTWRTAWPTATSRRRSTDVDAPENWPRTLTLWRSNLLGSSAKGNEYFLKHLLGTHCNVLAAEGAEDVRPRDVTWRDEPPEGKLDLLLSADFRMTSTTLLSDIVLPAATWYEKHDLSSTDMHPFVHAFTPAIDPPWEAKSDFEMFHLIARELSEAGQDPPRHPPGPGRRAAAARHPGRDGPARRRRPRLGARRRRSRSPARPCRPCSWSSATTPRSPTSWPASGRWPTSSASPSRT